MKQYKCFCCDRTFNEQLSKIDGKYWCKDCMKDREYIMNLIDEMGTKVFMNVWKEKNK